MLKLSRFFWKPIYKNCNSVYNVVEILFGRMPMSQQEKKIEGNSVILPPAAVAAIEITLN